MSEKPSLRRPVAGAASWLAIIGAAIGILSGLLFAGIMTASGITAGNLPSITSSEPTASPTPKAKPSPTPKATSKGPQPSLSTDNSRVPPGQKFRLRGKIPGVKPGEPLQVQVKDDKGPWDDFPVTTPTRDKGAFETTVYTSRTGDRKFRLIHKPSGEATPTLKVTIG